MCLVVYLHLLCNVTFMELIYCMIFLIDFFIIPLFSQRPCLVQSMGLKADTGCNPNRALTNPVVCSWTFCICSVLHVLHEGASYLYVLHLLCALFVLKLLCKGVITNPVGRSAVLTNPVAGRGHMEPWDMASSTKQTIVSRHRITNMAMNWTRYVLIQTWFFSALFFSFPLTQT